MRRVVPALLVAGSLAYLAVYLGIALARMRYPYELEWMEGGMVEHVRRLVEGRSLYARPSLEFVSFLYPPGYYLAGAALSPVLGVGLFPLRLLSFLSSLGVFAVLFFLAWKETGSRRAGVVAVGIFAATFPRSGGWLDLARLDSFYLLLLLAGAAALRHAAFRGGAVLAGLLLAAAFFTKQSAVVAVFPLLAYQAVVDRRRGLAAAGAASVAVAAGLLLLHAVTSGWFAYYCFTLPSRHPRIPGGWWSFWVRDLAPALPFALLPAIAAVRRGGVVPALALGMVASSWSVRSVYGAELNNLLPAFAGTALLAATCASRALVRDLLLVAQLAWLAYVPAALVPSAADRAAGDRIVERLRAVPGHVFIPHHVDLARLAGKEPTAHTLAMDNVYLDDRGEIGRSLEAEVRRALSERRFGAAVIESDKRYEAWILEGYAPRERLVDSSGAFWPVTGGRLRPERLALPRSP